MKWTKERPTEPGWYWWRLNEDNPPRCMQVREWCGNDDLRLCTHPYPVRFSNVPNSLWAGPIPEPEDET